MLHKISRKLKHTLLSDGESAQDAMTKLFLLASKTNPETGKLYSLKDREYFMRLYLMLHGVLCHKKTILGGNRMTFVCMYDGRIHKNYGMTIPRKYSGSSAQQQYILRMLANHLDIWLTDEEKREMSFSAILYKKKDGDGQEFELNIEETIRLP